MTANYKTSGLFQRCNGIMKTKIDNRFAVVAMRIDHLPVDRQDGRY